MPSSPSSSKGLTGWYKRALRESAPRTFAPTPDALVLSSQSNTMGGTFVTLALFLPNIAVDGNGNVISLRTEDFDALIEGARQAARAAPQDEQFFQWRISHPITCRPITNLYVKSGESAEGNQVKWDTTRVYGFSTSTRRLEEKVGQHTELPDAVFDILSALEEASGKGEERDLEMVERVKEVLNSYEQW